jgi:hypothetical protein
LDPWLPFRNWLDEPLSRFQPKADQPETASFSCSNELGLNFSGIKINSANNHIRVPSFILSGAPLLNKREDFGHGFGDPVGGAFRQNRFSPLIRISSSGLRLLDVTPSRSRPTLEVKLSGELSIAPSDRKQQRLLLVFLLELSEGFLRCMPQRSDQTAGAWLQGRP